MINILESEIVKQEVGRIRKTKKDFDERDVEYDISLLRQALSSINDVLNDKKQKVFVSADMWEECHASLDRIVDAHDLQYEVNEEEYTFAVMKKEHTVKALVHYDDEAKPFVFTVEKEEALRMLEDYFEQRKRARQSEEHMFLKGSTKLEFV